MTDKNRLPPLSQEQWSEEQRVLAEEVINGPRGALLPLFRFCYAARSSCHMLSVWASICATVVQ